MHQIEDNFFKSKEIIVSGAVAAICSILAIFFPENNFLQSLTKGLFFFFLIPVLYIKFVLKKEMSDFGLNVRQIRTGVAWGLSMLLLGSVLMYLVISYTDFFNHYAVSLSVVGNFWIFIFYNLVILNIFLFFQEYFFRGFVLNVFSPKFFAWSILIETVLYAAVFLTESLMSGKSFWTSVPFIILSLTGGVTAYKSKSMVYSWISGVIFLLLLNSYLIHIIKAG